MKDGWDVAKYVGTTALSGFNAVGGAQIGRLSIAALSTAGLSFSTFGFGASSTSGAFMGFKNFLSGVGIQAIKTTPAQVAPAIVANTSKALVKTGVNITVHGAERLAQRGVSKKMAEIAIRDGQKFFDPVNKSINFVMPKAFASGKSLMVATNPVTGNVTTVIRSSKNLIKSIYIAL
jgi:hypothetical protein